MRREDFRFDGQKAGPPIGDRICAAAFLSVAVAACRLFASARSTLESIAAMSPMNARDYHPNWKKIIAEIRERASTTRRRVRCECRGECLKHRGRCEEINRTWPRARRSRGKVKIRLTTAHLCHMPKCTRRPHLRAMCEPCHLIYDLNCRQRGLRGGPAVRWAEQQSGLGTRGTLFRARNAKRR
jgi:hypothetical protein